MDLIDDKNRDGNINPSEVLTRNSKGRYTQKLLKGERYHVRVMMPPDPDQVSGRFWLSIYLNRA